VTRGVGSGHAEDKGDEMTAAVQMCPAESLRIVD